MLNIDADFSLTDDGVWFEYDESKFKVAHISNLGFQRALARLQQPYRKKIENGTLDPKISRDLMCKAMAEHILLDWQDVVDGKGDKVPYDPQIGEKLLKSNGPFRDAISEFAMNVDNFKKEEKEELGKS